MAIKAFVFDCGGVVLRHSDRTAYERWGGQLGLSASELDERLWSGEAWRQAEIGQLSEDQYWQQVARELGIADQGQIDALRRDLWDSWIVDDNVLALVDRLRERSRVVILSNASDILGQMLTERYRIADRFERIYNSALLGIAKPDPAIYERVLADLDLKPQEIVFIDDRAENVAAAAAMGIHVVWFVHSGELERQLSVYMHNGNGHESALTATDSATDIEGDED